MSDWKTAFQILQPLADWPSVRVHKLQEFYQLGRVVDVGCIVELGTFRGLGAIALALGARDGHRPTVYTIDDRIPKRGWAGELYEAVDRNAFASNLRAANIGVNSIVGDVRAVALRWQRPVGLLVWDLGLHGRLATDVAVWERHLLCGGRLAIKDIAPPGFGREQIEQDSQWVLERAYEPGCVYTYRRVLDRDGEPPV